MQIYTKILIGMAVGATVGITLGPRSSLLEHDLYKIDDAAGLDLRLDPADPGSSIRFPPDTPLRANAGEVLTTTLTTATGQTRVHPAWVAVRFEYTPEMALRDPNGHLLRQLGDTRPDGTRSAWLHIEHKPIDGGTRFQTAPVAISSVGDTVVTWFRPVGQLFLRLITMVIVPLVFASLLVGVAGLGDPRRLGRLGGKTLLLYLATTAIAVTIGLTCARLIDPGSFIAESDQAALRNQFTEAAGAKVDAAAKAPSMVENVLNIVPTNPVAALANGAMLQIIFCALIFGIALTLLPKEQTERVVMFFDAVQNAMIKIIHMVMALAPYGVAALVAEVVGTSGVSVLQALLMYSVTVLVGLTLHAGLVYGGIVQLLGRLPLLSFLRAARPAQLIAFSTSSSSAALPVTMSCAQQNLGVSRTVSSFVLPLGSTVNMDGTALYQGVAAVFIAQVFQIDLSIYAQLQIVLTATMASIGAAGVPGAGMVTLAMVLTATGIPTAGVALILGMDRLLDMFRTAVNVTGDLAVTSAIATSEGEKLKVTRGMAESPELASRSVDQ